MAETLRVTVLNDEDTFTSVEGTRYMEFTDPDAIFEIEAGTLGHVGDRASRSIDIEALVDIAEKAKAYLNAEVHGNLEGFYERRDLVDALINAGLAQPFDVYSMDPEEPED